MNLVSPSNMITTQSINPSKCRKMIDVWNGPARAQVYLQSILKTAVHKRSHDRFEAFLKEEWNKIAKPIVKQVGTLLPKWAKLVDPT